MLPMLIRLNHLLKDNYFKFLSPIFSKRESIKKVVYHVMRFDPIKDNVPYIQTWFFTESKNLPMMLDVLFYLKKYQDESFAFRRSCREGICGSCAMNINGFNTLACTYQLGSNIHSNYYLYPLPHMPIIKDLVICMKNFYEQYKSINPFLVNYSTLSLTSKLGKLISNKKESIELCIYSPIHENLQSKDNRLLLDGLYECILCACCSTSCPSYWWTSDRYLGPAVLLQTYRWIIDSRDDDLVQRVCHINDVYKLYRCHTILNCSQVCPKHLSPASAISNLKLLVELSHSN